MADAQPETTSAKPARTLRGTPLRDLLWGFVHLAVLSAFGIGQPLLNLLGKYPAFFAAHNSTGKEVIGFGLFILLIPPLILIAIEALVALVSARARVVVHLVFVAGLAAVFALQIVRRFDSLNSSIILLLAIVIGVGIAVLYSRAEAMRSLLSILGLAPILFLFLFVFVSPVSKIVSGSDAKAYEIAGGSRPPIVMLVLDAFPLRTLEDSGNKIDPVRYPAFASLERDGVWYRNATTEHENTVFSVPSILDGKIPDPDSQPIVADHPNNLFTLLGKSYDENVQEVATNLCPPGLCKRSVHQTFKGRMKILGEDVATVYQYLSYPKDDQQDLPPIGDRWQGFRQRDTAGGGGGAKKGEANVLAELGSGGRPQRVEQAINQITNTQKPQLNFAHVLLPHEPRQYLPDRRQYQSGADPDPGLDGPTSFNDKFLTEQAYQRTMLQVQFTDKLVGDLIAHLKKIGAYDKTMIIVVSDHGESFKVKKTPASAFVPGKLSWRRAVAPYNIEDIAPVPLFVKYPKGTKGIKPGKEDSRYVKTIDMLPTVASVLGIKLPFKVDGKSFYDDPSYKGRSRIEVEKTQGGFVRSAIAPFAQKKVATLDRQLGLFGTGHDSLFAFGPNKELVGKPVSALPVGGSPDIKGTINDAGAYAKLNPDAAVVPTHVKGRLSGGEKAGHDLALALNGKVVAVGESFADLGTNKLELRDADPGHRAQARRQQARALRGRRRAARQARPGRLTARRAQAQGSRPRARA